MDRTARLTLTAVFAALTCIATFIIKIPVPATQGYIHFGDAFVLLAGIFPGAGFGMLAAGIGSALADLFSGYAIYAPATFIIKAVCAIVVTGIYKGLSSKIQNQFLRLIIAGAAATAILTGGYLAFESVLYGAAALVEIPMNIIQGCSGIAIACGLLPLFSRIPEIRKHM